MAQGFSKEQPLDTDVTLGTGSNYIAPSQGAVQTFVNNRISAVNAVDLTDGGNTTLHTHNYQPLDLELSALATTQSGVGIVPYYNATGTATTAIFQPVFTTYTPTITASSGVVTLATGSIGQYCDIGNIRYYDINFAIVTNGTGAGALRASLVSAVAKDFNNGVGRETELTSTALLGFAFAGQSFINITKLTDTSYPGGDGRVFNIQFWTRTS